MKECSERSRRTKIRGFARKNISDETSMEQQDRLERQRESSRRAHEWKMMLTEKGLIVLTVSLLVGLVTFCGNMLVERYKSDAASEKARVEKVRTASNDVWRKLVSFEESVDALEGALEDQRLHNNLGLFKADRAGDARLVEAATEKTKAALSALWVTLRAEELDLGPAMHGVFFQAMQDEAEIRCIYESEGLRGGAQEKFDAGAIEEARVDLRKQQMILSSVVGQL